MSTPTASSFRDLVRSSQLLGPAQLTQLDRLSDADWADPQAAKASLVELGLLTAYQVDQILNGKAAALTIGPYQVVGKLEGSTAYLARHQSKPGTFVVKPIFVAPGAPFWDQLVREAGQAGALEHPGVAAPTEVGIVEGKPIYVRPFVDGMDLARRVRDAGPFSYPQACELLRQAAEAMYAAHARCLTHRRLRPTNLILTEARHPAGLTSNGLSALSVGSLQVVDLGLGSLPSDKKPLPATPGGPDPAVCQDIRDLGKIFAVLLGMGAGARSMQGQTAPLPPVPPDVATIVRTMQTTDPTSGYRSMADVIDALGPWCPAPTPAPAPQSSGAPETMMALDALPLDEIVPQAEPLSFKSLEELAALEAAAMTHAGPPPELESEPVAPPVPVMAPSPVDETPAVEPEAWPRLDLTAEPSAHQGVTDPMPTQLPGDEPVPPRHDWAPPPASELPSPVAVESTEASPESAPAEAYHDGGLQFGHPATSEDESIPQETGSTRPKSRDQRLPARKKRGAMFWTWVVIGLIVWSIAGALAVMCYIVFTAEPPPPPTKPTKKQRAALTVPAVLAVRPHLDRWPLSN